MKPTNRHLQYDDVDAEAFAIVHESAKVSRDALVGSPGEWRTEPTRFPVHVDADVVIQAFVTVDAGCHRATSIGARTLLMKKAHVGHDTVIGEDCDVAPSASIGGCCTIGSRVKIGMNASVRPHVTIGDGARIGNGAAVVRDVPAGETWAGVPARRIR